MGDHAGGGSGPSRCHRNHTPPRRMRADGRTNGPSQQLGIALVGGGYEEWTAQAAAEAIESNGDVLIFVGVDADDDVVAFKCDAGHGC